MISEKLLYMRTVYLLLAAAFIAFLFSGVFFALTCIVPAILCGLAGLVSGVCIINLYNNTNRSVALFFNTLRNEDTTLQFPERIKNKTLAGLFESMNLLSRHFQEIRLQNEYNEKYYKSLIRHSAAGLLVLNHNSEVELINEMACRYAGISPESTNPNLLKIKNISFYEAICRLTPGEGITYKNISGHSVQLLYFRATLLKKNNITVKLVSIQDIRQELETKELESYRKLISVMTHEIMNLMSPITSVSRTLHDMYHKEGSPLTLGEMNTDILSTTLNGLKVIEEQSEGMISFMNNYRQISRIPMPVMSSFGVSEWMEQIRVVYTGKMNENGIEFQMERERTVMEIVADKKLLNQVIVNLINNAFDAVMEIQDRRRIDIFFSTTPGQRTGIRITNNGPAIPADLQEKIFVPFFTTKKEGSGIGLSISQEIVKLHKGSLLLTTSTEGHTCFVVEV